MHLSKCRHPKHAVVLLAAFFAVLTAPCQSPLTVDAPGPVAETHAALERGPFAGYSGRVLSPAVESEVDAPVPWDVVTAPAPSIAHERKVASETERNTLCESGEQHGKPCRVSWPRVLGSSFLFLAAQHGGNIGIDEDARKHVEQGHFWDHYVTTLQHYRWSRWNDDDPFGVDYIGHPLMGAITNAIYEQNDPKQRALVFENTRRYWVGRLRATAFSAAYSAQWKVGPLSESSIGNVGIDTYYSEKLGRYTNETGMVDFFVTPAGGLLWNVGEDYIDKKLFRRVAKNIRNPLVLIAASMMTPAKAGANILRFRAPYYRDLDAQSVLPARR